MPRLCASVKKKRTPADEVNTSHSKADRRVSSPFSIQGTRRRETHPSEGTPRSARAARTLPTCSAVPVTRTGAKRWLPRRSGRAHTFPTTSTRGAGRAARSSNSPKQPRRTCCKALPAQETAAAGISSAMPPASRSRRMADAAPFAIKNMSVPSSLAREEKSGMPSAVWAVTTRKERAAPRWVRGMPANPAAAAAEVTPGTYSASMPAADSASASSPPLPNTNGSPPCRRTVRGWRAAPSNRARTISPCSALWLPARLPM